MRLWTCMAVLAFLSACGVKGPPLPPFASTPQQSDRLEGPRAAASPQPANAER